MPSRELQLLESTQDCNISSVHIPGTSSGPYLESQSTEILLQIFAHVPDDSSLDHPRSLRMVTKDMSSLLLVNHRLHGIAQTVVEMLGRKHLIFDIRSGKSFSDAVSGRTETLSLIWNAGRSLFSDNPPVSSAATSPSPVPASASGTQTSKQHLRALYLNCGAPDPAHHGALQSAPEAMKRFSADALILTSHHPATMTTAPRSDGATSVTWYNAITKEDYPTVMEILRPGEWGNNMFLRQLVTDGGPTLVHLNRSCSDSTRSSIKKLMQLTRDQKDPQHLVLALDDSVHGPSSQNHASILRDLRAYARNMAGITPDEVDSIMSRVSVQRVNAADEDLFGLALCLDDAATDYRERVAATAARLPNER